MTERQKPRQKDSNERRRENLGQKLATLIFLRSHAGPDGEVLLAMKDKKIGKGKWNGPGGMKEVGETFRECAARELEEEFGVKVLLEDLEKIAIGYFHTQKEESVVSARVDVYQAWNWTGTPIAGGGMSRATWFPIRRLPLEEMMPADRVWVPIALSGSKIIVKATFTEFQKELVGKVKIKHVSELSED